MTDTQDTELTPSWGSALLDEITTSAVIDVAGGPARSGPLMWGQRLVWNDTRWLGRGDHHLHLVKGVTIPPGCTTEHVLACIARLVERHEVLRSHIVVDDTGEPAQEVPGRARMTVLLTSFPAETAEAGGAELFRRLERWPLRFPENWPVQFVVAQLDGRPHTVCYVASHVILDGTAARLLDDELAHLLRHGPNLALPPVPTQPLDRAAWEQSSAGQATSARSLARMEEQLRLCPQTMFALPRHEPDNLRFKRMEMRSPALSAALRQIAAQWSVSTSMVLLAGAAAMLGTLTANRMVLLKSISSNRGFPDLRRLVSVTLGNALYSLDVTEGFFSDLVRAAAEESLRSLLRSQCDPGQRDRLVDRVNHEGGVYTDLAAFFHDIRGTHDDRPADRPGNEPRGMAGQTVINWVGEWERLDLKLFFHATTGDDGGEQVYLTVDTMFVPSDRVRPLLLGLERLLVAAAASDVSLGDLDHYFRDVPQPVRGDGWYHLAGNWVELSEVRAIVDRVTGSAPAAVFVEPDGTLVAFVATHDDTVRPESLHHAVVRELSGHPAAVAPDLYVVCWPPPPDQNSRTAWDTMSVTRVGDGRGYHLVR